jgi:hypothetical protein
MNHACNAFFSFMAAIVFLVFSPYDAPGGTEVAIGGFAFFTLLALWFYIRDKVENG